MNEILGVGLAHLANIDDGLDLIADVIQISTCNGATVIPELMSITTTLTNTWLRTPTNTPW